jgi:hypothetical protein
MKPMSEKEIVVVKRVLRDFIKLVVEVGLAIKLGDADGLPSLSDARSAADDLVEGINAALRGGE